METTITPLIVEKTDTQSDLSLPWQVVVYDDPVNLMSYVTLIFQKIFGWSKEQAERHMLEVHTKGCSIVWVGPREEGELYVEKLHGFLLTATLEKIV
ncbi:MAG: ATP-dependent Clp protease adapter ClpS [Chthoniobacterales bacterium]|nr:ATP-dependent Clp protease adapter ClpS [Chthoniobacterales bacterium]